MQFVAANISHLEDYITYIKECDADGNDTYETEISKPDAGFQLTLDIAAGKNLPEGFVAQPTYFAFDAKNPTRILGAIRLRLGTNHVIETLIGQVGYETRPSEQGKGIATEMLNWLIRNQLTEPVVITCYESNIASVKVIERCGGIYESKFERLGKETLMRFRLEPLS